MVIKYLSIGFIFICGGCTFVIVLFSPAKQRAEGMVCIPKIDDYSFPKSINNFQSNFLDKSKCFSTGFFNVVPNKSMQEKIVLFSNGRFLKTVFYSENLTVIANDNISGFGGYYFIKNDTLNVEYYGECSVGHAYYYDKYLFQDSQLTIIGSEMKMRMPKKSKLYRLGSPQIPYPAYNLDSSVIISFQPYW